MTRALLSGLATVFLAAAQVTVVPSPQRTPQGPGSAGTAVDPSLQAQPAKPEKPGKVTGRVTNSVTGEPIKRANITLMPAEPRPDSTPFSTASDAGGSFTLADITPGKYRIFVERTGFVRQEYGARGPGRMGTTISVAPGQEVTQIEFRLQPHAVITGRVTDEEGEPIAYVQVQTMMYRYMQGRRQLVPSGGGMTNDLGEYRIFGLAPGRYYLSATVRQMGMMMGAIDRSVPAPNQPELGYAPTYYPGTHDPAGAVQIQVAAGRPLANMDMRLTRTRTVRVRGRLIGASNNPMSRPMISLMPRDAGYMVFDRQMMTSRRPDGSFELRGVIPGAYYLIAQSFDAGERQVARVPVDVGNTDVENVELALAPGQDLTGTVRVESDTPVNPSTVRLFLEPVVMSPMGGGGGPGPVKEDGSFVIRSVAPDTYRVRVMGGQNQFYLKSVTVGQDLAKDGEFTVTPGTSPVITVLVSTAGGQVSGTVKGEKDTPAQGATVVLVPDTTRRQRQDLYRMATTDQYGKFSLTAIAPGDYKLFAWDNVETGQWMDPEFLQVHESRGKSLTIRERAAEAADLELLKNESAEGTTAK